MLLISKFGQQRVHSLMSSTLRDTQESEERVVFKVKICHNHNLKGKLAGGW